MRGRYKNSVLERVQQYMAETNDNVILRSELADFGSARQVGRALKIIMEEGKLVRFGYGVYAKSEIGKYSGWPIIQEPFSEVCVEALNKLGVDWELGTLIKDYNEGRSQQVPVRFIVKLKSRFRGKLGDRTRTLMYEKSINAK